MFLDYLFGDGGYLRKALPMHISIDRISALVQCLCILHNYCINEELIKISNNNNNEQLEVQQVEVPPLDNDNACIILSGWLKESLGHQSTEIERICDVLDGKYVLVVPLLDAGDHYDDLSRNFWCDHARKHAQLLDLPRTKTIQSLHDQGIENRSHPRSY